jgi:hypothetical protein
MSMEVYKPGPWDQAARFYLAEAVDKLDLGQDAIASADAALACLKIEAGEQAVDLDLLEAAGIPDDEQPGDGQDGGSANERQQ